MDKEKEINALKERLSSVEKILNQHGTKIEEIEKDLGTKTESPRGFIARSKERPERPITVNLACRAISKPEILEGEFFNGWYYQVYNTFYHSEDNEYIRGEVLIDVRFTDKNEISGCRPFVINVCGNEWHCEYDDKLK